jgi:hypothetical protein
LEELGTISCDNTPKLFRSTYRITIHNVTIRFVGKVSYGIHECFIGLLN